ncbi:GlxA family transcriptional regulator [Glaciecola sp. 1036]|uniref:GlxA family transcriptional regulator n=1 Tax=Alteromonadaceae TaxID=72275 RepID=UPI003D0942E1
MLTKKIGFLLFNGLNSQDLVGPLEVFSAAKEIAKASYDFVFIGESQESYKSESGLAIFADVSLTDISELDTLIIPGGSGARNKQNHLKLCSWIKKIKPQTRRIASICTGAFLLAETGLLDGKKATTHWAFVDELAKTYPKVKVCENDLYVDNGDLATSAGITSGIDLALRLVENDLGSEISTQVARYLVVHYRRAGDQAQFSEPLKFQQKADTGFSSLTGFIMQNLQRQLSVGDLANHCAMSERNFYRQFTRKMGQAPAKYIETLRLDYARQLLVEKKWPLERISQACGYLSADAFRRAFHRRFSISPSEYRGRFTANEGNG